MNKNLLLLPASALLLVACGGNGPSAEFNGDPVTDPNEVVNALNSALSNIDLAKGLSISLETDGKSVAKTTDSTASMQIESTTTVEYDVKLDAKVAGLKQNEAFPTGDIYVEAGLTGSASLSVDMSSAGESLMNTAFDIPSLDEQLHIKDNVLYVDISEGAADVIGDLVAAVSGSATAQYEIPQKISMDLGASSIDAIVIPDSLGEYEETIRQMLEPNAVSFATLEVEKKDGVYNIKMDIDASEYNAFMEEMIAGSASGEGEYPIMAEDCSATLRFNEDGTELYYFMDGFDVSVGKESHNVVFPEAMADAAKTVVEHFKGKIAFINVMKNLSVDCDCCAVAEDPCMKDIGMLASLDPVAIDQACIDLVWNSDDPGKEHFKERVISRNGLHTIEAAEEIGVGSRDYELIEL